MNLMASTVNMIPSLHTFYNQLVDRSLIKRLLQGRSDIQINLVFKYICLVIIHFEKENLLHVINRDRKRKTDTHALFVQQ